jgi:hypothetical protein
MTSNSISLNEGTSEVIRIDAQGFHYRGQFIVDAGEAHRLLVEFLRQHQPNQQLRRVDEPGPPTDDELDELFTEIDQSGESKSWRAYARAALAEPEPEGPTDEKLTLTYSLAVAAAVDGTSKPWPADLCERAQLAGLRAVLARWGSNNISRSI